MCIQEILGEPGLAVGIVRLRGIFSSPYQLLEYADGHREQIVAWNFEAEAIGDTFTLSNETTEVSYFALDEIRYMDVTEKHVERLRGVCFGQPATIVR